MSAIQYLIYFIYRVKIANPVRSQVKYLRRDGSKTFTKCLNSRFIESYLITSRTLFAKVSCRITGEWVAMSKTDFNAGDLIFSKEVDPSTLKAGDIISYQSTNTENYGEVVTHKIRELTKDAEGNPGFITYGTTTDQNDENIVSYGLVLGKYQTKLPGVGKFFQFLKTTPGYIVCIFLPFLLLILVQGINSIRLFKRYKQEQLAEIEAQREQEKAELAAERERLEAERQESQKMMAELLQLKKELTGKDGGNPSEPPAV